MAKQAQFDKARLYIRENLAQLAPIFVKQKHMLGDEFSMLDVAIGCRSCGAWEHYQIEMPKTAAPLLKYAERLFLPRQAFIDR